MNPLIAALCRNLAPIAIEAVVGYLRQFGYLNDSTADPVRAKQAVESAQQVLGVTVDGVVGPQTLKAMQNVPRCGCADVQRLGGLRNQWDRQLATGAGLLYTVDRYTTGLSLSDQNDLLELSFKAWSNVSGIKFRRASTRSEASRANLIISSSSNRSEEFGESGKVLAWCELPQGSGFRGQVLMKFDDAELWMREGDRGILFQNVATHEIGHGLGLDHTQVEGELMFPIYDPRVALPQKRYDIPQMVERYGDPAPQPAPEPAPSGGVDKASAAVIAKNFRDIAQVYQTGAAALESLART